MSLVLDASAALAWIFERQDPGEVERANRALSHLDQNAAIVPEIWHLEVLNGLLTGQRRGVITVAAVISFIVKLDGLPIQTDPLPISERKAEIFALAREYELSAYDAVYLDLALRTGGGLLSFDRRLTRAQQAAGVPPL